MFDMLKNIAKAGIAVVVAPVDAVVDVVTIPVSAGEGKDAFHRTEKRLKQAADAMDKALEIE